MVLHFTGKNDKLITDKFLSQFERMEKGEIEHWRDFHYGRLAYILIADQFSRAMLRGTARAFSMDKNGFEVSMSILDDPEKKKHYRNHEFMFIILPVMHNENVKSIDRVIVECKEGVQRCNESGIMTFRGMFEFM